MAKKVETCPQCGYALKVVETVTKKKAEELKEEMQQEPAAPESSLPACFGKPEFGSPECRECPATLECAKTQECWAKADLSSDRCLKACPVNSECAVASVEAMREQQV